MLLYMSESFRSSRKLKGLMLSGSLERFGCVVAHALIDPGQNAGVLLGFSPVFIRPSRQFVELIRDRLFEVGRDTYDARDLTRQYREAEMLRCSEKIGSVFGVSVFDRSLS